MRISAIWFFHRNRYVFLLRRGASEPAGITFRTTTFPAHAPVKSTTGEASKEHVGFATQTIGVSGKPIYQPSERIGGRDDFLGGRHDDLLITFSGIWFA